MTVLTGLYLVRRLQKIKKLCMIMEDITIGFGDSRIRGNDKTPENFHVEANRLASRV